MIRCTHCGYPNREDDLFCTHCGAKRPTDGPVLADLIALNAEFGPRNYALSASPLRIGREDCNDIVIKEEQVSKHHASVFYEKGQFWVENLKSTNGLCVNGKSVEDRSSLNQGDLIKIGTTILRFELRDSARRRGLPSTQPDGEFLT